MKKQISFLLTLVSAATIISCQQTQNILPDNGINTQTEIQASKKLRAPNPNWYDSLSSDLKSYYAPAKGKVGSDLFKALHEIIKSPKVKDYGTAKSFMYSTLDNTGKGVFDRYSYQFINGSGGNGNSYTEKGDQNGDGKPSDFINCEHTWPQSMFEKNPPMVSDLHHMFPTASVPNEMRGHFPFGVAKGIVGYTTNGGSKLGLVDKTGKNRQLDEIKKILELPHDQKATILENEFEVTFEPLDKQKGDTSRAMLYMYLAHYDKGINRGSFHQDYFWDSKVSTFIDWSENKDPVDQEELKRNTDIQKYQGNRNPFVDIPNLASTIGEDVLKTNLGTLSGKNGIYQPKPNNIPDFGY
ncbi:MAG: endonuclease [Candidatus Sericytochromatia bacterium]